jgi:murein DD-endopeptidase MepM/ murein hydrolase activator NlpD
MLRKRHYILFVTRDSDGRVRKIPVPMQYFYGFVAAALVGAFTIMGLAGSYTRMLLKTESFNQMRREREQLRQNYRQMAQIAHDRDVQVASLGAIAGEVSAIYGLKAHHAPASRASAAPTPASLALADTMSQQQVKQSLDEFYALRTQAMSGKIARALEGGADPNRVTGLTDWTQLADVPTMWPVEGQVTSSFGERVDPFNGEGEFHTGIDISAPTGTPVRATGDGVVDMAGPESGYGRQVEIDHGHGVKTTYGHLSAIAVMAGQSVTRGQVVGYVGRTGRATGPNLHYEVRINNVPVNPHQYLRLTYEQASADLSPK